MAAHKDAGAAPFTEVVIRATTPGRLAIGFRSPRPWMVQSPGLEEVVHEAVGGLRPEADSLAYVAPGFTAPVDRENRGRLPCWWKRTRRDRA